MLQCYNNQLFLTLERHDNFDLRTRNFRLSSHLPNSFSFFVSIISINLLFFTNRIYQYELTVKCCNIVAESRRFKRNRTCLRVHFL